MRIAVNTRLLLPRKMEGLGWYAYEVLKRICCNHPEHEFIFLFDRKFDEKFIFSGNITPVVLYPPARHPLLFYCWFEWAIPHALKKHKADLFFSPDGFASLSSDVPQLITIHDLNFEHYPNDLKKFDSLYYRHFFNRYAHKAKHIITVSEYSKNDIINSYRIKPEKITRIYNGINTCLKSVTDEEKIKTKKILTQENDYLVFVGALHPRKNISRMLQAFDIFKKHDTNNIKLVIIGEKYFWNNEMKNVWKNLLHKKDVIFTGHLQPDEMKNTLGAAIAMIYVSYFEGFGLPVIEAMQCKVPVITSNITSLPEIAGNAALLVDPFSTDTIADAMYKITTNYELRTDLIKKGILRAKEFSWDECAENVWKTIEKCLHA